MQNNAKLELSELERAMMIAVNLSDSSDYHEFMVNGLTFDLQVLRLVIKTFLYVVGKSVHFFLRFYHFHCFYALTKKPVRSFWKLFPFKVFLLCSFLSQSINIEAPNLFVVRSIQDTRHIKQFQSARLGREEKLFLLRKTQIKKIYHHSIAARWWMKLFRYFSYGRVFFIWAKVALGRVCSSILDK